ncbi:hypothetical protein AB1A81_05115 [Bdellovibrio bacteriovorus]|uniref:Uncharacterized protein n=1 Tax=Bdellovibrio bacteriovorus (strain ATCC 15356 / DSM 50701 / NCIMB 9529 / HD100) TaxID=264462 RepID=Q6MNW6_BDEBA|nr:hypothetical protein [Bdellovibrio bacteriovorus]CAE79035.1 hypothetical protein predicted by Glimmer/Critica [Bdellovibrio bacteriovorus HD100]
MKKVMGGLLLFTLIAPVKSFAKDGIGTGDFNQMIEENNAAAKNLNNTITRNVSSEGTFKGEVITVVQSTRNPVKYNPFLLEDEVEVKSLRDQNH